MKYVWKSIDNKNWKTNSKNKAFLCVISFFAGLIGFIMWSVVQIWALKTIDWTICFVGYSVVISWAAVFFYTSSHEFHDGIPLEK